MKRRHCLGTLSLGLAGGALWSGPANAHGASGPVAPPTVAPDLPLLDHMGRPQHLRRWMEGRVTLLQTIFTGCSSVCPIQGAVFAQLQGRLEKQAKQAKQAKRHPVQLLSISIDALGDSPQALRKWLEHMQAQPTGWAAALPQVAGVDDLRRYLDRDPGVKVVNLDAHSEKVYFFNAQAQLCWRSNPLPSVDELFNVLNYLNPAA